MKKKIMSTACAFALALSMSSVAFADPTVSTNGQDLTDVLDNNPVVPKTYVINNGTAPSETFTFAFEGISYENGDGDVVSGASIPAINNVTIPFGAISSNASKTVEATVNPNDYQLGVYTYRVTEVTPGTLTAGTTYSEEELFLVLTILRDESSNKHYVAAMHYETADGVDKSTGFTNEYDAGQLAVTKEITGNMADMDKKFAFTVTFTPASGSAFDTSVQIVNDSTNTTRKYTQSVSDGVVTIEFELGDGETATFTNLPEGTAYTVVEDFENYESDGGVFSDSEKIISADDEDTVVFTNELTNEIDTAAMLDSMPFVVMLVAAGAGLAFFAVRRRQED